MTTDLGYTPDALTYSASGTGCTTVFQRYQRRIYGRIGRSSGRINSQTITLPMYWATDHFERARAEGGHNGTSNIVIRHAGTQLLLVLSSETDTDALLAAMRSIQQRCVARVSGPPPRPTPAPKPAPPPAPRRGERIEIERIGSGPNHACRFRNLPRLLLKEHVNLSYIAGPVGVTEGMDQLSFWGILNGYVPDDQTAIIGSINVQVPVRAVGPLTGELLLDGRPSGMPMAVNYDPARNQSASVWINKDKFDITGLSNVTRMTLNLRDSRGAPAGSWTFDVSDARFVRAELNAAGWKCV